MVVVKVITVVTIDHIVRKGAAEGTTTRAYSQGNPRSYDSEAEGARCPGGTPPVRNRSRKSNELFFRRTARCACANASGVGEPSCVRLRSASSFALLRGKGVSLGSCGYAEEASGCACACAGSEGCVYWTQWTPRRLERARMGMCAGFEDEAAGKAEVMAQVGVLSGMVCMVR